MESQVNEMEQVSRDCVPAGPLRFRRPDRSQTRMVPLSLEETIPPGHHVRVLWAVVERLDLSKFTEGLKVSEGQAGRSATDVRLLVALWLYAATQGVGSARELERLCEHHAAYRWLCGGVQVNYHTLSDFRVSHEEALDGLMTEVLAMLMERKLVSVHRISQDGMRVRASTGKGSFRRERRLNGLLDQAKGQVEALKAQRESPGPYGSPCAAGGGERTGGSRAAGASGKGAGGLGGDQAGQSPSAKQSAGQTQPAACLDDRQ